MAPLSLLFSSDQETSRLLRQALYELEFDVEHCREIFAAVEKLTSKSFEVIVADFDDGLEASFLVKTARELKANSGAFMLAITSDRDANAAARRVGADLVLNKPIVTEVAKYSLLTSDAFLRGMKNWLPKLQIAGGSPARPQTGLGPTSPALEQESPNAPVPLAHSWDARESTPNDRVRRPAAVPFSTSAEPVALWPYVSGSRKKHHHRSSAFVFVAALAMVFLSVGYVFSAPTRGQVVVSSVATVCERALAKTKSWLQPPPYGDSASSEWAQNEDPRQPGARSGRIRVTEVHDSTAPLQSGPATRPPLSKTTVPAEQDQIARVTTTPPIIPESLRTPVVPGPAEVPPRVSPSLLAALQPVDLPEEFSAKLLLQKVEPRYPAQALQAGLQGPVVLRAWIGKDGKIQDLKLIRGSLLLGQAAYHAVKQWRYKPYLLNGQAVEAQTYVTVNFKLP